MTRLPAAVFAIAIFWALPASAQIGAPGFMRPQTPEQAPGEIPPPHVANTQDRLLVLLVGSGNMAEIELGRMAQERGESEAVQAFGQRMVEDHQKAQERLTGLAEAADIAMPDELTPDDAAMRERVAGLEGEAFDRAYIAGQVTAHQKAVTLMEWQVDWGQDPELKRFVMDVLPDLFEHLRLAQTIQAALTGSAPPVVPASLDAVTSPPPKPR